MTEEIKSAPENIINLVNNIEMTSQRLRLHKFGADEVEFNVAHEMDAELMKYIRDPLPQDKTRERTEKIAREWTGANQDWAAVSVRLLETGEYIGLVCLRYESIENDTMEIGWRLDHKYQGKGYATEAAKSLLDFIKTEIKPHKVVACCVAENTASSNIMHKLGMEKEAHFRENFKIGGKWTDAEVWGLLL